MADRTKLVSLIVLIIVGLAIALWGVLWMIFKRRDDKVLGELKANNLISAEQYKQVTPSTWAWAMAIVQVVLGVFLIGWGMFQYFSKVEKVQELAQQGYDRARTFLKDVSNRQYPLRGEAQ